MSTKITYEEIIKKDTIYNCILPTKIVSPVNTVLFRSAYILTQNPDRLTPQMIIDATMKITNSYVFIRAIQTAVFMSDIGIISSVEKDQFILSSTPNVTNISAFDVDIQEHGAWDDRNFIYIKRREENKIKEYIAKYHENNIVAAFQPFCNYKKDEIVEMSKYKRNYSIHSVDWLTALQDHFEVTDKIVEVFRNGIKWHNERAERIKQSQSL